MRNNILKALSLTLTLLTAATVGASPVKASRKIIVHGHRGTRGTRPENTLPAFEEGVKVGVDFLELDLHYTKDHVLVISHDAVIAGDKCLDKNGQPLKQPIPIRELTLSELKAYDCGSVAQKLFPEQKLIPHTPHPTFEELVAWVTKTAPKVGLNIETKMDEADAKLNPDPHKFALDVIQILRKYHRIDKDLMQSFDFSTLTEAKKIEPKLKLACLFEDKPANHTFCEIARKIGAQDASPELTLVNEAEVKDCHAHGIGVVPWTANQEADWARLIKDGVDGIITDYPKKLIDYLTAHPSH